MILHSIESFKLSPEALIFIHLFKQVTCISKRIVAYTLKGTAGVRHCRERKWSADVQILHEMTFLVLCPCRTVHAELPNSDSYCTVYLIINCQSSLFKYTCKTDLTLVKVFYNDVLYINVKIKSQKHYLVRLSLPKTCYETLC